MTDFEHTNVKSEKMLKSEMSKYKNVRPGILRPGGYKNKKYNHNIVIYTFGKDAKPISEHDRLKKQKLEQLKKDRLEIYNNLPYEQQITFSKDELNIFLTD